ncbi:hypothetical protein DPSP01_011804 [Paraphaeosphaeria sporulosa]|uniref:F-box/WD repeat-containing protein lin-23 n=1 Tax=Paraphaeosphaeria sporulosa TaxID=1460663 RepID=A0A177CH96_9PLEO|nr:F-box/WD repeat-containing protein lin-23 [Paraphaeosphaeria sporulosa]OAG06322.1 F-box/WD repeat-containing protein lin-23 [Paraphaeosphaeria sporulosa]
MHHRSSITHRPKTSSAADDSAAPPRPFEPSMKRTASQTFSTNGSDAREAPNALGAVHEGMSEQYHSHHAPSGSRSLSRATSMFEGGFKQIRRKLSSSSSRRPSLTAIFDNAPGPSSSAAAARKNSSDMLRLPLPHHDSGLPLSQSDQATPPVNSKISMLKRFSSLRRRPAASGPSGEFAKYNPVPPPIPSNYPLLVPGSAARQAAAAANDARLSQLRREQEQTRKFLENGMSQSSIEEIDNDNESGVGMMCSSPIVRADSVLQEKKMVDPLQALPAEITTLILSNLDAPSLIQAELVSKHWHNLATSPHVWKDVFLRRFEPTVHVTPTPIQMGGVGVGMFTKNGKHAPAQNWKQMYRTRKTIDRRWKAATPNAIYLNGHTDSVYCCQFDESKIITGSRDRTIRVWDMNTYECIKVIGGPTHRPVSNTPPAMDTHRAKVVNNPSLNGTEKGNDMYHVPADYHDASILCLQYDDTIMVTGSSDHTCIVWDITGKDYVPMYRLRGHQAGVLDVCLDDKHIISCSKDSAIIVWDRQTGRQLRTLTGHRGPVNAVQLRGNLLVSASGDGVAKLWNLDSGVCIKDFPSEDRGLAAVEFSDDAKYVLAGGNDHVVYKFDAQTGNTLHTSQRHGGLVRSLFLDAFNGRIVSGSYDQSIRVADYSTGAVFATYENWTTSWILSAKSDYRRVVATSQDGRTLILDFGWNVQGAEALVSHA